MVVVTSSALPGESCSRSSLPEATDAGRRSTEKLYVVSVDGRPLMRMGLARLAMSALGCRAAAVAELGDTVRWLKRPGASRAVVLLGVRRQGDDPVAAVEEARRLGARVICVLDCEDAALIHAALAACADGYLLLDLIDSQSLRATVAAVAAGERWVPPELEGACRQERGRVVTARSLEVLRALADGLHDEEIAERLSISASSVRKHICCAQERLRARTRTQAVALAARRGLL